MNEIEKMINVRPVCCIDEESDKLKLKAHNFLYDFNNSRPDEMEKRNKILSELFGEFTDKVYIEPDFHCDFGFNIYFKGKAFINYNCVMLDTGKIYIGNNAFIGPGTCLGCPEHSLNVQERNQGICCSKKLDLRTAFGWVQIVQF